MLLSISRLGKSFRAVFDL